MSTGISILYVGETWKGSSARSLRDGLISLSDVWIDELGEDHYIPKQHRSRFLRLVNRALKPWHLAELYRGTHEKLQTFRPDIFMVYKGGGINSELIKKVKAEGIFTVNIFPDYSPHAYGRSLKAAMGEYDLVVSTKPFQPEGWNSIYGYENKCVFVPHGYDPEVHLWNMPLENQDFDIAIAVSWRPEYQQLLEELATQLGELSLRVVVAGPGWKDFERNFPADWKFTGPLHGRAYGELLRRGKIVIAPLHTKVVIDGVVQPGDQDTTRTYELAAAYCFFLHRRTPYAQTVYDEEREVPMWDTANELSDLIKKYLPLESERRSMAAAAHTRAVPAYSTRSRAARVLQTVLEERASHTGLKSRR